MVDAIDPISSSISSSPIVGERSLSIASEPDNKWIAERQAQIDADLTGLAKRSGAVEHEEQLPAGGGELPPLFEGHSRERRPGHRETEHHKGIEEEQHLLSGESDKIGTVNFDDDTPFGKRVAII